MGDFGWERDPAPGSQTLPAKVDFGQRPDTAVVGTWNGSDANVATIRSKPFQRPAGGCVLIPVLHGPSVNGLALRIIDTRKGASITQLPLQPADEQWQYWRVTIDASVEALAVEAQDAGKGWGEWIAVATPQACP
jgi:hypothetical protein